MTRMYIQPSFIDSCADHAEWSGGNGQYRGDRSADLATFDKNGRARVEAFTDEAIEGRRDKPASKVSLKDRILPQQKRVSVLTQQMRDLCAEYKQGMHTPEEYTMLLQVLSTKRARAEQLLAKAVNVQPKNQDKTRLFYGKTVAKNCVSDEDDAPHSLDNNSSQNILNRAIGFVVLSVVGCMGMVWLVN
jgi:hypothetical protein